MPKKKSDSHIGAWLMVDEKNKRVEYQVDPRWFNNVSDDEQKTTMAKLNRLASAYRRAGYAIFGIIKKIF